MSDRLPEDVVWDACQLVGHVHVRDADAVHAVLTAADTTRLHQLVVALAAMVDEERSAAELLGWAEHPGSMFPQLWRKALTEAECIEWHRRWSAGDSTPQARDGEREYQRRRKALRTRRFDAAVSA